MATVEEIELPRRKVCLPCFTVETLSQLDSHLTPDLVIFDTQTHPPEDDSVLDRYCRIIEDSLFVGDNYHNNEIRNHNDLVTSLLLPVGIMSVDYLQDKSFDDL